MIYNTQLVTEKDNQTTTRTSKPNYPNSKNQQKKNDKKQKWPVAESHKKKMTLWTICIFS